jgi:hypothetical protein
MKHSIILARLMGRERLADVTQDDRRALATECELGPEAIRHWERKRQIPRHWIAYFRAAKPELFR